jgi:hypothetical protein
MDDKPKCSNGHVMYRRQCERSSHGDLCGCCNDQWICATCGERISIPSDTTEYPGFSRLMGGPS